MLDATKIGNGGGGRVPKTKAKHVRPIHNRVIVKNMHFGDTTSNGGIIILSDDGKDRGIKPRWGQVFSKGPKNNDPYDVGDWILVEHGRWTRSFDIQIDEDDEYTTMRAVEAESVLLWSNEKPKDILFGEYEGAGSMDQPKPEDFGAR